MGLSAIDAISFGFSVVSGEAHPPAKISPQDTFLVFNNIEDGLFINQLLGVVDSVQAVKFPSRIFEDLLPKLNPMDMCVTEDVPLHDVESILNCYELSACVVNNNDNKVIGVVNKNSIIQAKLFQAKTEFQYFSNQRFMAKQTTSLLEQKQKFIEFQQTLNNVAFVASNTEIESKYLQSFLTSLRDLIGVKYAAIKLVHPDIPLNNFLYSGISQQLAQKIGRLPGDKGLFAYSHCLDAPVIIDDIAKHQAKVGFPPHHPDMKSLLISALKQKDEIYGHVYLCDKKDGSRFNQDDSVLVNSFSQVVSLLLGNILESKLLTSVQSKLANLTNYDRVTGLPKKDTSKECFELSKKQALDNDSKIAFIIININDFKRLNDALGRKLGDDALSEAAKRIEAYTYEGDIVTHVNVDEFLLIINNIPSRSTLAAVVKKYATLFDSPFELDGEKYYLTARLGIAAYPLDGDTFDDLYDRATTASHLINQGDLQKIQFYSASMDAFIKRRLLIESRLRSALLMDKLDLHFQPQIDIKANQISGFEALLRWYDDELGVIAPDEFIPIAEQSGLIIEIGAWVLKKASDIRKNWLIQGYQEFTVAVNVSAKQLQEPDFADVVKSVLVNSQLNATLLELEITENCALDFPDYLINLLDELTNMGVKLSIDDFGTGYSNLSYLTKMPLESLKIDRSFIVDISSSNEGVTIPFAIIDLARSLGLSVIAEGVESKCQLDILSNKGCTHVQGHYFSKPLSEHECELLLRHYTNNNYQILPALDCLKQPC